MKYDSRFTLISVDGKRRHPEMIDGAFAVGKQRVPSSFDELVKAVLVERKGARFVDRNGDHKGVLSWANAKTICAYELEPATAVRLGLPTTGTRNI